jgi:hypothetical protein
MDEPTYEPPAIDEIDVSQGPAETAAGLSGPN